MVLSDLGRRLTTAFRDLQGTAPIDENVSNLRATNIFNKAAI